MSKVKITKWLRIIHRDLGYLMVGVSIIYAFSGILLNHMGETDPAFESVDRSIQIEKELTAENLSTACKEADMPHIKRMLKIDNEHTQLLLEGGIGVYNSVNGTIDYEVHKRKELIYWMNRLHYNRIGGWSWMADFFAVSLMFFAISGLFMVKGRKGIAGRGKWFLLIGLIIPIIYILI